MSLWVGAVCVIWMMLSGSSALGALMSVSCPTGNGAGNDPVTVGGTSYSLSCGGLKVGGFSTAYFEPFGMSVTAPQVNNSVVQLVSATFNVPSSGMSYVELNLLGNPPGQGNPALNFGQGNIGVNFAVTGWAGGGIVIPQTSNFAEVSFCRPGHDALGPSSLAPHTTVYAWIGCYDSLSTQYANLAFAENGSPPVEGGDSPGITDVSGSIFVIGQTSPTLPANLTARFWTFGPGTTTVDIQAPAPEPGSASLMLAALIALGLISRRSRRGVGKG